MTAPVYQTKTNFSTTSTSPFNISVPSGLAADDILVIIIGRNNFTAITSIVTDGSVTTCNSVQARATQTNGANYGTVIYWKRAIGDETIVTFTGTLATSQRDVCVLLRISGADWTFNGGVPIAASTPVASAGGAASVTPNAISVPTGVSRDGLYIAYCIDTGTAFNTTPGGYTGIITTGQLTSTGLNHIVYQKTVTATGDTPGNFGVGTTASFLTGGVVIVGTASTTLVRSQAFIF
jgi:hypothetical protein